MNLRTGSPEPDEDDGVGLGACKGCDLVETGGSVGTKEANAAATVAGAAAADVTVVAAAAVIANDGLVMGNEVTEKGVGVDALVVVSSSSSSSSS